MEVERRELDRYHDGDHRNLTSMPSDGEVFGLDPGRGVYVPSWMPHWVQNGPRASVSLSITFRSRESLRAEYVHWMNARMRRLHLHPTPAGVSPARDRAKEAVWLARARLSTTVGGAAPGAWCAQRGLGDELRPAADAEAGHGTASQAQPAGDEHRSRGGRAR